MCDPVTGLIVASTLLSAGGQIQQGNAANASAKYNAQISNMNASIADKQARDALERGKLAEQEKRRDTQRLLGAQTAAYAANGVDLSFGSPLDTITGSAALGEIDALTIRSNANREAYDFEVKGSNLRAQANLQRAEGKSAKTGSLLAAGGTLLGGAGKGFESFKKYNG